ncbi:hypothetical protein DID76_00725 [Candidatus Marinamargulisbacteria bacterium SCGC AG-414-C22]|nr:hypothetical protein DID76_00725 [Candidatus Marinamargulisbacteria bacterium SCGC AG-414-C22]
MKIFLKKISIFSIILFGYILLEIFMPYKYTTFRAWETLKDLDNNNFIKNRNLVRDEYGDLAFYTKSRIKKSNIRYRIDSFGKRNDEFKKNAEIILIGDSIVSGASLSQEDILSSKLIQKTHFDIYNLAPASFNQFKKLIEDKEIKIPKVLVYGVIERNIPNLTLNKNVEDKKSDLSYGKKLVKKFLPKIYFKLQHKALKNFITAKINRLTNYKEIKVSPIDDKMIFFQGAFSKLEFNKVEHEEIIKMNNFCEKMEIKFIFLPIPNKETVYFNLIPLNKQPDYLIDLFDFLQKYDILTVNTLEVFNQKKANNLIYHYDDTHWNKLGVDLVATELAYIINKLDLK